VGVNYIGHLYRYLFVYENESHGSVFEDFRFVMTVHSLSRGLTAFLTKRRR
jgi:hypothetical protein